MKPKSVKWTLFPAVLVAVVLGAGVGLTTSANGLSPLASTQLTQQATVASNPLGAKPGQVIHTVMKTYEKGVPDPAAGGPQHADPAYLFPDTVIRESYAVVGTNNVLARVVTYNKDASGQVFTQAIIDGNGRLTVYNSRHGISATGDAGKAGEVRDVDTRQINLSQARATQEFQTTTSVTVSNRPATVLEDRSAKKRLAFDQKTGALIREEQLETDAQGQEQVVRSTEWQLIEVLDAAQVSASTLSPNVPVRSNAVSGVAVKRMTRQEASRTLPFSLYTIGSLPEPTVAYMEGQHIDLTTLPIENRGLHFAVNRGDAAGFAYNDDATKRYVEVREGPTARFAESLQASQAFWDKAKPISVNIGNTAVSGWYLTSTVKTSDTPGSNNLREVPGATYLLLPDVSGTGILLMTQSYSESELLALAGRLQH